MTECTRKALQCFASGYSCAQSILIGYREIASLDEDTAAMLAAGMGAGIGRLRQTCGAFSALAMLAGFFVEEGQKAQNKGEVYALVQKMHQDFLEKFSTDQCAALLKISPVAQSPIPQKRTTAYYASRPCAHIILEACRILEKYIPT